MGIFFFQSIIMLLLCVCDFFFFLLALFLERNRILYLSLFMSVFNIFSILLVLSNSLMCREGVFFTFFMLGVYWASSICELIMFIKFGDILAIILSNIFLYLHYLFRDSSVSLVSCSVFSSHIFWKFYWYLSLYLYIST